MATKIKFTEIKTLEDAFNATGCPATPAFADAPEDMREYFQKQYEAAVVAKAINGDWRADWNDPKQRKWIPWIYNTGSSGFAFDATCWHDANADAGYASRLCFETKAQAEHAGRQFTDLFAGILTK